MFLVFIVWAGLTITAHALLLMWYATSCYGVWKKAASDWGFLRVLGRAAIATAIFTLIAAIQFGLVIFWGGMLGLGPEAADKLQPHTGLAFGSVFATFLLPWNLANGNMPTTLMLPLAAFFVLGLLTMLPGLGYGSKAVWSAVGLAGYVVSLVAAITTGQEVLYAECAAVTASSMLASGGIMWLCTRLRSGFSAPASLPDVPLDKVKESTGAA